VRTTASTSAHEEQRTPPGAGPFGGEHPAGNARVRYFHLCTGGTPTLPVPVTMAAKGRPRAGAPAAKAGRERKSPPLAEACVSQQDIAGILGLSDRRIRDLTKVGMPRSQDGYPVRECVRWYTAYREDEAVRRVEANAVTGDSEERLMAARAGREEIKLAKDRAEAVTVVAFHLALDAVLGALRRRVDNFDTEYSLRVLHLTDPARARAVLADVKRDFLSSLASACDTLDVPALASEEEPDEGDDGEDAG
jgi:phage terminase Nu1 subunit (DNA packaging protein)